MPRYVLDSFAFLALFLDEPGAAKVQELIEGASQGSDELFIPVVNLGEVLYTVENRRGLETAQDTLAAVQQSLVRIVDVDQPLALSAARLKATTGMGYLDCFIVALAQQLEARVVTGDIDFKRVEELVTVEWLPVDDPQ
ncbi:MAG: type II toxin-antitoxin system VapC family toxin [Dehalococcoidia bacterium]